VQPRDTQKIFVCPEHNIYKHTAQHPKVLCVRFTCCCQSPNGIDDLLQLEFARALLRLVRKHRKCLIGEQSASLSVHLFVCPCRASSSTWFSTANAHNVLTISCGLKSSTRYSAILPNVTNSFSLDWLAIAVAHAVFARSWALNSVAHRSAVLSRMQNNKVSNCSWVAVRGKLTETEVPLE